ncbi:cold shock domain-containing protein 3 [Phtheirospermum japonicum]|uniref:Cold shock domain-containing protein 3 n=1 Tax=Phtheirospermum japonicum TaxID=374723 RepID=A0A830C492_9LAMI|nr:cold shock domain-containing protein 3 [Phtheirospermum japonicum]
MAEEKGTRSKGVVTRFNDQKGYGFIKPDGDDKDLFVHQSAVKSDGYRTLRQGQEVEFNIIIDDDGKMKAGDVTPPGGGTFDLNSRRGNNGNNRGDRRNNGNGFGNRNGGGDGVECYQCGEYGHMVRSCKNGGNNNGGGTGGSCYNCGGYGHMARECPSEPLGRGGDCARSGGSSRGGGGCFYCGELGHKARECTGGGGGGGGGSRGGELGSSGGSGGNCFNCGQPGHFVRECKQEVLTRA